MAERVESGQPMEVANFSSEFSKNHFVQKLKINRNKGRNAAKLKIDEIRDEFGEN